MASSNTEQPLAVGSSDDLTGLHILLVEDSWQVGRAVKSLLGVLGATVDGPAASTAEAECLLRERTPDAAIIDFRLRDGEPANDLIDRLHDQGVSVIVVSGYEVLPVPTVKAEAVLQKPVSEAQLIAVLRPLVERKSAR